MGSSFLKIMTVARDTFHGPEVFASFFQWCINIHKTPVSSALTTTCIPHEWYSKTILAIVVSSSATHWKQFWNKWLLKPAIKWALVIKKWSWDFTHFSSDLNVMSGKTLPLLFVCCISFVEGPLPQQSNTKVFRITYTYRKTS